MICGLRRCISIGFEWIPGSANVKIHSTRNPLPIEMHCRNLQIMQHPTLWVLSHWWVVGRMSHTRTLLAFTQLMSNSPEN